jgi:phosphatidylglycerophosphate synthase
MVNKLLDCYECPIDIHIFKLIDSQLETFYNLGLTPNMVTTLSIVFGLLAAYAIMQDQLGLAALGWLIAYYLDCVDGKLARKYQMVSKFGDLYDHIGDLLKFIAVLYALFYSKKEKTTDKQWFYLFIILILGMLQVVHMGYQECIYNKKEESEYLNIVRLLCVDEENAETIIHFTKYFGCGTWYLCFTLLILFWRK